MSTPLGEMKEFVLSIKYRQKGDTYQIAWKPSLIFPDMSGNDKISIQVDNAKRGEIVDRNGSGLAINKVFDEVGVVPGKLGSGAEKQPISKLLVINSAFLLMKSIKVKPRMGPSRLLCTNHVASEPVTELPTGAATKDTESRYYPLGKQLRG